MEIAREMLLGCVTVCALKAILLFLKHPEPGQVKTRLAATLGPEQASAIYRRLVAAVCAALPEDAQLIAVFDPPGRAKEVRAWLGELCAGRDVRFVAQVRGDLGVRLTAAFADAFSAGFDHVAAIGSDCIELDATVFTEAWRSLQQQDVAIGPTPDGGYYLIALRSLQPHLFAEISWSTEAVWAQTRARAAESGLRVHVLPLRHDVDTEEDWLRAALRLSV